MILCKILKRTKHFLEVISLSQPPFPNMNYIIILLIALISSYALAYLEHSGKWTWMVKWDGHFFDGFLALRVGYSLIVILSLWFVNRFGSGADYLLISDIGSYYCESHKDVGVGFVAEIFLYVLTLSLLVFHILIYRQVVYGFFALMGSAFFALLLLSITVLLIIQTGNFGWITLFLVLFIDRLLSIISRFFWKMTISESHKLHLYKMIAEECGFNHIQVSLTYIFIQAAVSIVFIISPSYWTFLILTFSVGSTWLFLRLALNTN